jgi:hypothetical protein
LRKIEEHERLVLEGQVATANRQAADANRAAGEANQRATANEKEAAQLRQTAEQERLARIKIENSVAWRTLSQEQQRQLVSRLMPFAGQLAEVHYNTGDVEASNFADQIALVLQQAKWHVPEPIEIFKMREGFVPIGTNPPLETGVTVASTGDKNSLAAADALLNELVSLGFDSTKPSKPEPAVKAPAVVVWIEHRPKGAQGEAKVRSK